MTVLQDTVLLAAILNRTCSFSRSAVGILHAPCLSFLDFYYSIFCQTSSLLRFAYMVLQFSVVVWVQSLPSRYLRTEALTHSCHLHSAITTAPQRPSLSNLAFPSWLHLSIHHINMLKSLLILRKHYILHSDSLSGYCPVSLFFNRHPSWNRSLG